jgi:anti-sigma factor (TIGR02949 family)
MTPPAHRGCREIFERLDDYVDRELTAEEQAVVLEHLRACAHCASAYAFEAGVIDSLKRTLRRITAPPQLLGRILESLERAARPDRPAADA